MFSKTLKPEVLMILKLLKNWNSENFQTQKNKNKNKNGRFFKF
jgi:hypothetical protein